MGGKSLLTGKAGSTLVIIGAGRGISALRVAAKLATWRPRPAMTTMSSVTVKADGSFVTVGLAKGRLTVMAKGPGSSGRSFTLKHSNRSLPLVVGNLKVKLITMRQLVISTPELMLTISQVQRWHSRLCSLQQHAHSTAWAPGRAAEHML